MPEPSDTPVLTAETITKLIARLGGQLDKVESSAAPAEAKAKVRDKIVPLMHLLHSTTAGVPQEDLGGWVEAFGSKFEEVASLLRTALNLPAAEVGGCFYRLGDSSELVCVMTTADACEGVGRFDPAGCPE